MNDGRAASAIAWYARGLTLAFVALCGTGCYSFAHELGRGIDDAVFGFVTGAAALAGFYGLLDMALLRFRKVGWIGLVWSWLFGIGIATLVGFGTDRFDPHPGTIVRWLWATWLCAPAVVAPLFVTARFATQRASVAPVRAWFAAGTGTAIYVAVLVRASMVAMPPAVEGRFVEIAITDHWAYGRTDSGRLYTLRPTHEIPGRYRMLRGDAAAALAVDEGGKLWVLRGPEAPEAIPLEGSVVDVAAGWAFQCVSLHTAQIACMDRRDPGPPASPMPRWHERTPSIERSFEAVEQVAVSSDLLCALERGGRVRCRAGSHDAAENLLFRLAELQRYTRGELEPDPRDRPGAVLVGKDALAVAATRSSVCVLGDDRRVRCAGRDEWSEVGRNARPARDASFSEVVGLDAVEEIVAGDFHLCARITGGEVRCWGGNGWRQLGAVGFERRHTAGRIDLPGPAEALIRHHRSTCARLTDGRFYCWGSQLAPGTVLRGDVCDSSIFAPPSVCTAKPLEVEMPLTYVPAR